MRSRPIGFALALTLSVPACSPEPEPPSSRAAEPTPASGPPSPPPRPTPSAIDLPPVDPPLGEIEDQVAEPVEPTEPTTPPEPTDPLAPILPDGPEPGSPEADAELAELLDESTITQEEFDKAFRGGGPNIQDDQFVFGPGQRNRATPVLEIGKPRVDAGSVTVAELEALARADERKLLGCHAVALTEDPASKGSVELRLRFDAGGTKAAVTLEGGEALAPSLVSCLIAVAESWRPKSAGGAKLAVPLELSTQ